MPKRSKHPAATHPATLLDLPERLVELEAELLRHGQRDAKSNPLKSISEVSPAVIAHNKVIEFSLGEGRYAAGHSDVTYSGSNHARGIRQIRLYVAREVVLAIEGDFEDQQFGSNFRFQNVQVHVPGPWEKDILKLTDALREFSAKRRAAFKQRRDAKHPA